MIKASMGHLEDSDSAFFPSKITKIISLQNNPKNLDPSF